MLKPHSRNPKSKRKARRLRNEMSISEKVLWERLRRKQLGFAFRRQFAVGKYILDFYCPEAMLCVEVDGPQHERRKSQDAARDVLLETKGVMTMRVPSTVLFAHDSPDLPRFIERIRATCEERTGRRDWRG